MAKHSSVPKENQNQGPEKIASWLKTLRFKKRLFGGADEADVWKKLNQLNQMYEQLLEEERLRYDLLLEERMKQFRQQTEDQPESGTEGSLENETEIQ